jgi:hypothetical protein
MRHACIPSRATPCSARAAVPGQRSAASAEMADSMRARRGGDASTASSGA